MPDRARRINRFLATVGWGAATRNLLAGDASARRYDRLTDPTNGQSVVLMDAPPDQGENVTPFLRIADDLLRKGLSAPKILASDAEIGVVLLEDLGDDLFTCVCADRPQQEQMLYNTAVDVLADLHRQNPPEDLPQYTTPDYLREARLSMDWYLAAVTKTPAPDDILDKFDALITAATTGLHGFRPVIVLRDYHAENLLWLPARRGLKKVGLLDFQDALGGHPAYDLMSLLEDARRDTSEALQQNMIARYLKATGLDDRSFRQDFAVLGAQRNLKIIGIFTRLCLRDHKPAYVDLIPRVWDHLTRDLAHPALADLKAFVAKNLPTPNAQTLARIREARQ